MSYFYEPYHSCSYKTMSLDELRLKSLLRRNEGHRSLDKAFEEAQNRIQEQVVNRNSAINARLSALDEIKMKAEDDAKRITPYQVKTEYKQELFGRTRATNNQAIPKKLDKLPKRSKEPMEPSEEKGKTPTHQEKIPEVKEKTQTPVEVAAPKEPEFKRTPEPEKVATPEPSQASPKEPEAIPSPLQEEVKETKGSKEVEEANESEAVSEAQPAENDEPLREIKSESVPKEISEKIIDAPPSASEKKDTKEDKSGTPEADSSSGKNKPPELVIIPSDSKQGDKIDQILNCDSVLDPSSKSLSPFEQNLVAFGQHFDFIPSPEPEKWESSESEEEEEVPEEAEEVAEEELTPYQAALKKKYEEEVCTTKAASWGGDKPRSKYDMSYLNVNQGEEIIHGNLFTQFKEWIRALKEELIGERTLEDIKSHQNDPVSEDCIKIDPLVVLKNRKDFTYIGEKNSLAMPHGDGEVSFENGDTFRGEFLNGERHGIGSLRVAPNDKARSTVVAIDGQYVHDQLDGPAKIIHKNGNIQHAFCSKGCLHGISKLFDKDYNIIEMGWYHSGHKEGQFWRFLTGGALLFGGVTETGKIGGDDVVYIYPDLKTCLKGTFVDEQMLLGQACYVEVALRKKDVYFIKTTTPKGPNYKYDPATRDRLCELDPLLPDPYEFNCVYIKQSRIKDAGEGIFAIKDFYKGEIVSFYNGIRMKDNELDSKSDEWDKNAYKIMDLLGKDENGVEGVIDIPQEFVSIEKYKASLSHKANHSFEPNAKFTLFHHARFGLIPSLMITAEAVAHDKEITVCYDYAMDDSPPWYQDLYTQKMINMYQESKNFEG